MSVLTSLKSFSSGYLTSPEIRIGPKTIKLNFGAFLKVKEDQTATHEKSLQHSRRTRQGAASIEQALNASPRPPVDPLFSARL